MAGKCAISFVPVVPQEHRYFTPLSKLIKAVVPVKVKAKVTFFIAYCYVTIIFQYAIVTDRAGVGYRLGPHPRAGAQACG